jgi:hypothetical protein
MYELMACGTQRNKVFFCVIAELAAMGHVVHL